MQQEVTLDEIHHICDAIRQGRVKDFCYDDQHNGKFTMANFIVELEDGQSVWLDCSIHKFPYKPLSEEITAMELLK